MDLINTKFATFLDEIHAKKHASDNATASALMDLSEKVQELEKSMEVLSSTMTTKFVFLEKIAKRTGKQEVSSVASPISGAQKTVKTPSVKKHLNDETLYVEYIKQIIKTTKGKDTTKLWQAARKGPTERAQAIEEFQSKATLR